MGLKKDFGEKYIVVGAENNPDTPGERARIVATFILAHDALTRLGYEPDISSLVGAYQNLNKDIRNLLDEGKPLPHLKDGKFAPVREYCDSIMAFLGDGFSFSWDKDERANKLASEVYSAWQEYPLPAYMLIEYAQSFSKIKS